MAFELIERGQKYKKYFDSETGQYRLETTIHDQHYKDENNQYQEVDEALVDDGVDGFVKKCDKTRHILRIGTGGTRRWYPRRNVLTEYVDITEIQYYTTKWRTLNLPTAVWKSTSAEWDMTNLYASITNTWHRVKADFVLKNSSAYTRLRFAVIFTGLTLDGWNVISTTESVKVGSIDPPTALDANGANIPVTATYADGYIEWSVNTSGAVFPVAVDPTFTDGYGGDVFTANDTYLASANPDASRGAQNYITAESAIISLLSFDLSSIAASATCTSATLYLYALATRTTDRSVAFHAISAANAGWLEGGNVDPETGGAATWDNKADRNGAGDTAWAGSAGLSTETTDYAAVAAGSMTYTANDGVGTEDTASLDTTTVKGWFGGTCPGLKMVMTSVAAWPSSGSSDHATTGYRPKLVVVYESGATTSVAKIKDIMGLGMIPFPRA